MSLLALLRLTFIPGLGPVTIRRLVEAAGSPDEALTLSPSRLKGVPGLGEKRASQIARGVAASEALALKELELAARLGVRLLAPDEPEYPPLLAQVEDRPPVLYIRGRLDTAGEDRYPFALVGSRRCTAYGAEQAERFASFLARAGITIASGGAHGIDGAAHRGALRDGGRTIVVLGCGLSRCYPEDHAELFDLAAERGAIVSELPLETPPRIENFPARNRIISGLSLGVLVIEAQHRSGALITARLAAEDHGREVFALPGRVDSSASAGTHALLKQGGALLVTEPADILEHLESPARHLHVGTHESRYGAPRLFEPEPAIGLSPEQSQLLGLLAESATFDELVSRTQRPAPEIRADLTILEIQRRVRREGSAFRAATRESIRP